MKILKINREELRVWRENVSKLVGEDGVPIRDVTAEEVGILADLDNRARTSRKIEAAFVDEEGAEKKLEVVPRVGANGFVSLTRTIAGNAIKTGREVMLDELFKKHGPFQLRTMNGRIPMASKRAPAVAGQGGGMTVAGILPDFCPTCKEYAGRQKGRHHWICQHNQSASPEQRGSKDGVVVQTVVGAAPTAAPLVVAPKVRYATTAAPAPANVAGSNVQQPQVVPGFLQPPTKPVVETTAVAAPVEPAAPVAIAGPPPPMPPESCPNNCTSWAQYAKDGEHHAICQWRQPWIDAKGGVEPRFLVNLETEEVLREATPEEIEQASANLWVVNIADVAYGVVLRSEIKEVAGAAE